jgi:hypothetical protein
VSYFKKLVSLLVLVLPSLCDATALGQITIQDVLYNTRSIIYEKVGDYAVVEGDILLGKIENFERKSAIFRLKVGGNHWDQNILPFEVSDELPLLSQIAVHQAVAHWENKTNVDFVEVTEENRSNFKDYIVFVPAKGTTCSSYVGRQGGRQEVLLSTRCMAMTIAHEIGHALGLWHEQSRADRANFIRILWENIEEGHQFNFDQHVSDGIDFGEYDYQSIMHYGAYAFSKNGEKTIVPLIEGVEIGQRTRLSDKDIAAVNAIYPKL